MLQINGKNIAIGSMLAAVAIAAGAFGAHGLKNIAAEKTLAIFETAVRYQLYHALALILVGVLKAYRTSKCLQAASILFLIGILLFSCSLYALVFFQVQHNYSMNWLGAVTPFGGVAFIAGWVCIAVTFTKKQ